MIKISSVASSAGLILLTLTLLGVGSVSQKTISAKKNVTTVAPRAEFDGPINCDIYVPAAPPCLYQTTPDGTKRTFVVGLTSVNSTSTRVYVDFLDTKGNDSRAIYGGPRYHDIWLTTGISDDGRFVYLEDRKSAFSGNASFILYRIDNLNGSVKTVVDENGLILDMDAHKNKMLILSIDQKTNTQKVILSDLTARPLRTLFSTTWKEKVKSNDSSERFDELSVMVFAHAIISPDATKAVFDYDKLTSSSPLSFLSQVSVVNLQTGKVMILNNFPKQEIIRGWKDNQTLILKNNADVTSTYAVK